MCSLHLCHSQQRRLRMLIHWDNNRYPPRCLRMFRSRYSRDRSRLSCMNLFQKDLKDVAVSIGLRIEGRIYVSPKATFPRNDGVLKAAHVCVLYLQRGHPSMPPPIQCCLHSKSRAKTLRPKMPKPRSWPGLCGIKAGTRSTATEALVYGSVAAPKLPTSPPCSLSHCQ
jgi:hypothetical protein